MLETPAPHEDTPHGLAGQGLGQYVGHIAQETWHGLERPQDAREDHVRVEDAQCYLCGVLLGGAHRGDDQPDGGASYALGKYIALYWKFD